MGLLRARDGSIVSVDDEHAGQLIAGGDYTPVTAPEAGAPVDQEGSGGVLGTIGAAGSSVLSGATLGGSDYLLKGLLDKGQFERLRTDREDHPFVSGAGQIAGTIAASVAAPETLLGKLPLGIAGRASVEAAEAARAAGGLTGAARALAYGGVEGALQNTGAYLSDTALGDRKLSAEGIAGAAGAGFGFGVAGGAVAMGVERGTIAARRLFARVADGGEKAATAAEQAWREQYQTTIEAHDAAADIARAQLAEARLAREQAGAARDRAAAGVADARIAAPALDAARGPAVALDSSIGKVEAQEAVGAGSALTTGTPASAGGLDALNQFAGISPVQEEKLGSALAAHDTAKAELAELLRRVDDGQDLDTEMKFLFPSDVQSDAIGTPVDEFGLRHRPAEVAPTPSSAPTAPSSADATRFGSGLAQGTPVGEHSLGEIGARAEPAVAPAEIPTYEALKAHAAKHDDYLEQTLPASAIADRGYYELVDGHADAVKTANARKAIADGQRDAIRLNVSPEGKITVTDGRHRLAAAIEAGAPIKVKWSSGFEPIGSDILRSGRAIASEHPPLGSLSLEQLREEAQLLTDQVYGGLDSPPLFTEGGPGYASAAARRDQVVNRIREIEDSKPAVAQPNHLAPVGVGKNAPSPDDYVPHDYVHDFKTSRWFHNPSDYTQRFRPLNGADFKAMKEAGSLTEDEVHALYKHTTDYAYAVNKELNSGALSREHATHVSRLDSAIAKSRAPRDLRVFRGIKESEPFGQRLTEMRPGEILDNPAPTSTSTSPDRARSIGETHNVDDGGGAIVMVIDVPKDYPASAPKGESDDEREILLKRGTRMRLVSNKVRPDSIDADGNIILPERVMHFVVEPESRGFEPIARSAGGTQGGSWFRDPSGEHWFGKNYGGNTDRVEVEHLANRIYRMFDVSAPETELAELGGQRTMMSKEIQGEPVKSPKELLATDAKNGFIIDAWLANWDVLGEDLDNMLVSGGKAHRIDNGGSTIYRAQGATKDFAAPVREVETMRSRGNSAGRVFSSLTKEDLDRQLVDFARKYDERAPAIDRMVDQSGMSTDAKRQIKDGLRERAQWLQAEAAKAEAAPVAQPVVATSDSLTGLLRGTKERLAAGDALKDIGAPGRAGYAASKAGKTSAAAEHFRAQAQTGHMAKSGSTMLPKPGDTILYPTGGDNSKRIVGIVDSLKRDPLTGEMVPMVRHPHGLEPEHDWDWPSPGHRELIANGAKQVPTRAPPVRTTLGTIGAPGRAEYAVGKAPGGPRPDAALKDQALEHFSVGKRTGWSIERGIPATEGEYETFYVVKPSELAERPIFGDHVFDHKEAGATEAWNSGKKARPITIDIDPAGRLRVSDGNHRLLMAARNGDAPVLAEFWHRPHIQDVASGREDIGARLRDAIGKEPRKSYAARGKAVAQEHPYALKRLEAAHDAAVERAAAATEPLERAAAEQEVAAIEQHMTAVGARPGAVEDIAAVAPALTKYESASADLVEALGPAAPAQAQESAKAFRATEATADRKSTARTTRAIDDSTAGPGLGIDRRPGLSGKARIEAAKADKLAADASHARARATETEAKSGSRIADQAAKDARAAADAARPAAPAAAPPGRLGQIATAIGVAGELGVPGIPHPKDIPLIGPLLDLYVKARMAKAAVGRFVGRVGASGDARAAALAARTKDKIASAVDHTLGLATTAAPKARGAIVASSVTLGRRVFDDGMPDAPPGASPAALAAVRAREIATAAARPDLVTSHVRQQMAGVIDPDLIAAAEQHLIAQFQWLSTVTPKPPAENPYARRPWAPSMADAHDLSQRLEVIHNPVYALHVSTPTTAETFQRAWPELAKLATDRLISRVGEIKAPMTYDARLRASRLTGLPMDSSLTPDNVAILRAPSKVDATPTPPMSAIAGSTNLSKLYDPTANRTR